MRREQKVGQVEEQGELVVGERFSRLVFKKQSGVARLNIQSCPLQMPQFERVDQGLGFH